MRLALADIFTVPPFLPKGRPWRPKRPRKTPEERRARDRHYRRKERDALAVGRAMPMSTQLYEYCAYVRSLITTTGACAALGGRRYTFATLMGALEREGHVRPVGTITPRNGRPLIVWEWCGC